MAKKAVATFAAKAGARSIVKCIRMDKSPKTGAYVFVEQFVDAGKEKEFFEKKERRIQDNRVAQYLKSAAPLFCIWHVFSLTLSASLTLVWEFLIKV